MINKSKNRSHLNEKQKPASTAQREHIEFIQFTPNSTAPANSLSYTPYGHTSNSNSQQIIIGFHGELRQSATGLYSLGNGHRNFNPNLMCFSSPDKLSPFKAGGLNSYAYCSGDPINFSDPSGSMRTSSFQPGPLIGSQPSFSQRISIALKKHIILGRKYLAETELAKTKYSNLLSKLKTHSAQAAIHQTNAEHLKDAPLYAKIELELASKDHLNILALTKKAKVQKNKITQAVANARMEAGHVRELKALQKKTKGDVYSSTSSATNTPTQAQNRVRGTNH
jgi:RHS repeat-associated protein